MIKLVPESSMNKYSPKGENIRAGHIKFQFSAQPNGIILPIISGIISLAILIYYHDLFWYAPDEGVFAHFADRVNEGKIYGVDFHGVQPGYHTIWNAFLFDIFGRDLVVLRYPLVLLSALQAALVAYMLRDKGVILPLAAGLWVTCFGFLQFINPSANWYAFYLAFFCIFILSECPRSVMRLVITGILIGVCLGIRHPSGVFLGAGVLSYLLYEAASEQKYDLKQTFLARSLLVTLLAGLFTYIFAIHFDLSGSLYIGLWPVLCVGTLLLKKPAGNLETIKTLMPCGLGVLIGIVPLFLYQMVYGDLMIWAETSILHSARILDRDFFDVHKYYNLILYAVYALIADPGIVSLATVLYWAALYSIVPLTGALSIYYIARTKHHHKISPVLMISLFFGYVSLYYQIPIYLFYSLGLYGIALFMLVPSQYKNLAAGIAIALSLFSMAQYIAMPLEHPATRKTVPANIEGASLKITETSRDQYNDLLKYINEQTQKTDYVFAFPVNPEIYFLSKRKNPTPYVSTAISISSDQEYETLLIYLKQKQPRLIINRPDDKYMGLYEEQLVSDLTSELGYKQSTSIGHFLVYKKE